MALAVVSCGEDRFFGASAATPTGGAAVLHILPELFTTEVACRPGVAGQLQSYVAELLDPRLTADGGFAPPLATSPPARCDRELEFGVPGGLPFALAIKGYDLSTDELRERQLEEVTPKWRAECGTAEVASDAGLVTTRSVVSVVGRKLVVRDCTPLRLAQETFLEVSLQEALGTLVCGTAAGQVASFTAAVAGQSLSAPCGETIRFSGLSAGSYTVQITANAAPFDTDAGILIAAQDAGCVPSATGDSVTDAGANAPAVTPSDAGAGQAADAAVVSDSGATPALPANCTGDSTSADSGSNSGPAIGRWQAECSVQLTEGETTLAACSQLAAI